MNGRRGGAKVVGEGEVAGWRSVSATCPRQRAAHDSMWCGGTRRAALASATEGGRRPE
jgi:hypothetical protein